MCSSVKGDSIGNGVCGGQGIEGARGEGKG